jgi:hypothetical protein
MRNEPPAEAVALLERDRRGDWRGEPGERIVVPLGREATLDDWCRMRGKAEIVHGQLILIGPAGFAPGRAAGAVVISLYEHAERHGGGVPFMARVGYIVDLPHRKSFCPDASWYAGPWIEEDFPRGGSSARRRGS